MNYGTAVIGPSLTEMSLCSTWHEQSPMSLSKPLTIAVTYLAQGAWKLTVRMLMISQLRGLCRHYGDQ